MDAFDLMFEGDEFEIEDPIESNHDQGSDYEQIEKRQENGQNDTKIQEIKKKMTQNHQNRENEQIQSKPEDGNHQAHKNQNHGQTAGLSTEISPGATHKADNEDTALKNQNLSEREYQNSANSENNHVNEKWQIQSEDSQERPISSNENSDIYDSRRRSLQKRRYSQRDNSRSSQSSNSSFRNLKKSKSSALPRSDNQISSSGAQNLTQKNSGQGMVLKQDPMAYQKALRSQQLNQNQMQHIQIQQKLIQQAQLQKLLTYQEQINNHTTAANPQLLLVAAQAQILQTNHQSQTDKLMKLQLIQKTVPLDETQQLAVKAEIEQLTLSTKEMQNQIKQLQFIQVQNQINQNLALQQPQAQAPAPQSPTPQINFKDLLAAKNKAEAQKQNTPKQEKKNLSNGPKLSSAQIENRKYSIYIKNLEIENDEKQSKETEMVKAHIHQDFLQFGGITHVSIDGSKKTAIIRFRAIQSAENAYKYSREKDEITQKRNTILRSPHVDAQVVYVIPEVSKEDELRQEAHQNNTFYNPVTDDTLTLDQITKLIKDKDLQVKYIFKEFCTAAPDSDDHKNLQAKLKQSKGVLSEYLFKEKQIKMAFAKKKQQQYWEKKSYHEQTSEAHSQSYSQNHQPAYSQNVEAKPVQEYRAPISNAQKVPVEFILSNIGSEMQAMKNLISILKPHGELQNCKFTNPAKTEAYIKFVKIADPQLLLQNLQTKSENGQLFTVRIKENS